MRLQHGGKGYKPLAIRDGLNPTRARVPEEAAGLSAHDFISHLISEQHYRAPWDDAYALAQRFNAGEVVLHDGTPLSPNSQLKAGQDVYFYRIPAPETPVPYEIPIVFEDEHLLVVDKPPFMATMPRARHITETATVRLRRHTGISELTPAHRLDRLTSGVLVFTKTPEVRGPYQTLFARREVAKTYVAIAAHRDFETPTLWASRMNKVPGELQGTIIAGEPNAFTELKELSLLADQSNLEKIHGPQPALARYVLRPTTGKTHQLRLHMWEAGVPILGDPIYPTIYPVDAEDMTVPMHLTAQSISFRDPLSGLARTFSVDRDSPAEIMLPSAQR